jgi:site-specific DNA-methyltransferase (adenine-specific)
MRDLEDSSIDAIVTDPPYGLSFMGKKWDYDVPGVEVWAECLRVLKPGGHLLAFAGTRTQHRMAVRIEDAGFEIRDMIAWVYGSGFPKSLDVSKAIDKAAGAEREVVGVAGKSGSVRNSMAGDFAGGEYMSTAPATPEAQQWAGWGTALKPALEPITVARKPLTGTVAANVLEHGTGALNIDGCRVATDERIAAHYGTGGGAGHTTGKFNTPYQVGDAGEHNTQTLGRWPANLIHDGSDEVLALFPQSDHARGNKTPTKRGAPRVTNFMAGSLAPTLTDPGDTGSAARFFYCAKASKADRSEGNTHPTVKPTDLMRYLCRLVTPPGGIVLDPFMGSGSTGKAAALEGFRFIGIERDPAYLEIARSRIVADAKQLPLLVA